MGVQGARYDNIKDLVRDPDCAVRERLASDPGTAAEILYFLVRDDSPEVRRAVAENPATPRKADTSLSRDSDYTVRCVLARKIVGSQKGLLESLLKQDEARASKESAGVIDAALTRMREHQRGELQRLQALRAKNPAVRAEEIDFLEAQTAALETHLSEARCRLEAVRVIVAGEA